MYSKEEVRRRRAAVKKALKKPASLNKIAKKKRSQPQTGSGVKSAQI
jgi:predicted transcriptional regulator